MVTVVSLSQLRDALKGSAGAGARTAATLEDGPLIAALNEAHAEVLGKLGMVYAVPENDTWNAPDLIRSLILAVASYLATLTWLNGRDLSDRDPVALRYARAQTMLRQVLEGTLAVDGLEPAPSGGVGDVPSFEANPFVNLAGDVNGPSGYPGSPSFGGAYTGGGWPWV